MSLIYQCDWPAFTSTVRHNNYSTSLSGWSSKNIIAFTPGFSNNSDKEYPLDNDTLCFCHPSKPWDIFKLKTGHDEVSIFKWDYSGGRMLTSDRKGNCKLWERSQYFMDEWKYIQDINVGEGESISEIFWIPDGEHYVDVSKMFSTKDLLEKFPLSRNSLFSNSLNEAVDGFIAITLSGHLKLVILSSNEVPVVHSFKLGTMNLNINAVALGINGMGKLFISLQTNPSIVELFAITFKEVNSNITPSIDIWPSIIPSFDRGENFQINVLRTVFTGTNDYIIVGCEGSNSNAIKIYEIRKEQVMLHPIFPTQQQMTQHTIDTPVCIKTINIRNRIQDVLITNIRYVNIGNNILSQRMIIIEGNGTCHIYSLNDWSFLSIAKVFDDVSKIRSISLSPFDQALFVTTKSDEFLLYSLPLFLVDKDRLQNNQYKLPLVSNLLEISYINEEVPWDFILALKGIDDAALENVIQLLGQNFNDQLSSLQNLSYQIFNKIKSLLYQLHSNGNGIIEANYASTFYHLYNFLIINMNSEKEISVFEAIQKMSKSPQNTDISKIVQKIDIPSDFTFSCLMDISHKSFIQWIFEYAIHIVRLLLSSQSRNQSWKLKLKYYDSVTFVHLRELLVMFYILYQKYSNVVHLHPIFQCMASSIEVTAQLFKFFTKLHSISLGDNTDISINDLPFSNLPLMYFQYPTNPKHVNVLTQLSYTKNEKYQEFLVQLEQDNWNYIQETAVQNPLTCGISTVHVSSRQIYDGINLTPSSLINGESVKQCCDCGCLSVYNGHQSRAFVQVWKDMFNEKCSCGGQWKKIEWKTEF